VNDSSDMSRLLDRVTAVAATPIGDLSATLEAIVAVMAREGQRGACVALVNERGELYIAAWDGEIDESVRQLRLPIGRGVMGLVVAEGRPIVLSDLDNPGPVAPANRSVGTNALTRSCIAVPIWYEGVVIGVLEMGGTRVGQFGDEDVVVLEAIGRSIADAVGRVEPDKFAAEVLRHRVHELTFLQDAAATLAASLEVADVAAAIARTAAEGTTAASATLLALHGDQAEVLATHPAGAGTGATGAALRSLPFVAHLAATPDAAPAPRTALPGLDALLPGAPAAAGVRVMSGGQPSGALLVAARDDRGFDPAQMRLLEGLASLAGLALANAESFERQRDAALRDATTGLLNRSEFDRRLAAQAAPFAVLAVDIDNLRVTNEAVGHEAGDVTLRLVASTLARSLAETGPARATVARTGGDEFGVLLPTVGLGQAEEIAEHLRLTMHGVAVPHGIARISVGCAGAGAEAAADPRQVWDVAVTALHRAKRWGRDRVEVSTATTPADSAPRWERVLAEVLATHAIRSVYQPIIRLDDRTYAGYEALARPLDASKDAEVGGLFAAAQALGMTRDLDWLCRRAAVQGAPDVGPNAPLFVNVGVWTLLDPLHDVDQMLLLLRWAHRVPSEVVLEITEREVVSDVPRLREVMAAYRDHGFRFALDDVGEGHSTLEILAAGRPEFVKLARSMVATANEIGSRSAIHAVMAFAEASGSTVIAEGIETPDELDLMLELGITLGQGFGLARPQEVMGRASDPSVISA
jgi:diguanylate cyclase (GGDEF)-like protein